MGPVASSPPCPAPSGIAPKFFEGLDLLRLARAAAEAAGRDAWELAVELRELRATGLTHTDLRWLLSQGYAEHALERVEPRCKRRHFRPLHNLAIPESSCFVLTSEGATVASHCLPGGPDDRPPCATPPHQSPHWDGLIRRLWWQGLIVKEYRQRACNQEAILAVLEEEGWPQHIDDPLPQRYGQDPKERLRNVVKALNGNQRHQLLRFRCDGTGQGLWWSDARTT